jgi:hypothetical protein
MIQLLTKKNGNGTHNTNATGTDFFTFDVIDGTASSTLATVVVTITAPQAQYRSVKKITHALINFSEQGESAEQNAPNGAACDSPDPYALRGATLGRVIGLNQLLL